ncbi:response regulator transcription factor [Sphingomonas alpina]|uniref:Response regulator n=1 Tax=Sphingomonas alpina TaxID=653931 RepID=A0A7H0LN11_9SPHN|nr:response regulator [Sphingomonas alpina]QNQ11064.1 response regulator [Sphingomonas alpina]
MPDPAAPLLLYVEDEPLIQNLVVIDLEEAGFNLVVADNGEQALQLLAAHGAELRGLITDVNLGAGPDGWEVARAARQSIGGLPVVYVSAASDHDWTSQGVPGSTMIAKPFAGSQLVVAISSLLVVSDQPS